MNTQNPSLVADGIAMPSESIGTGPSRPLGQPGLSAFTALAASRPEAWDGAEAWPANGPFSSLLMGLPPENIQQAIECAATWEELADIGSQLLNPWAQKNRGASDDCARAAWEIWGQAEWMVSAAPDGSMVSLRKRVENGNHWMPEDVFVPPAELARLQWAAAKRLLAVLAAPFEFEELSSSLASLRLSFDAEWFVWAQRECPGLISRATVTSLDKRMPPVEPERRSDEDIRDEIYGLAKLILGDDIESATSYPLFDFPMKDLEARAWRANQAYLWRQESRPGAFWDEPCSDTGRTRDDIAQAAVDCLLPRNQQNLCALGELLTREFGLSAVAFNPFGGAHRAKLEMIRAFSALTALADEAHMPPAHIGLGGLKLLLGVGFLTGDRKKLNGTFVFNEDMGPVSKNLAGAIRLSAPIQPTTLVHEWTHAWDKGLLSCAQTAMAPEAIQTLVAAETTLRQAALFEMPVSNATRRAYIRPHKREILRTVSAVFSLQRGDLLTALCESGNLTAKLNAQQGLLPREMRNQIRQIWRQIQKGDDDSVRIALMPTLRHFEQGPNGRSLDDWATDLLSILAPSTKVVRDRLLISKNLPNAGPMRWNAILLEQQTGNKGYWTHPMEMLARSSQRFFDTIQPLSIYSPTLPRGEEAERFNAVLKRFFEEARPAFDAVANNRNKSGPVVQLNPPAYSAALLSNSAISVDRRSAEVSRFPNLSDRRKIYFAEKTKATAKPSKPKI